LKENTMEIDANQLVENAVRDGLREGIKQKLTSSYSNPLDRLIEQCIAANSTAFTTLLQESLSSAIGDPEFRSTLKASVRTVLAKTLVQRFGGELEKQVNVLKSDPATRARITVAIEDILKQPG
jgi:hypothetical protein